MIRDRADSDDDRRERQQEESVEIEQQEQQDLRNERNEKDAGGDPSRREPSPDPAAILGPSVTRSSDPRSPYTSRASITPLIVTSIEKTIVVGIASIVMIRTNRPGRSSVTVSV